MKWYKLSGEIPAELGNLSNLAELDLAQNQLTGEVPPELGNLSKLTDLYLWENKLSGEIPAELGKLSTFINIDLSDNQFTGCIPDSLRQRPAGRAWGAHHSAGTSRRTGDSGGGVAVGQRLGGGATFEIANPASLWIPASARMTVVSWFLRGNPPFGVVVCTTENAHSREMGKGSHKGICSN